MKVKALLVVCILLITGGVVVAIQLSQSAEPRVAQPTMETLPNPASAFCEQKGYTSEIRTAADGSQSGVCIFPDGGECEEWAFYRGECTSANSGAYMPNPASVFCEGQGFKTEIRTAADGSQSGVCIFSNGSECDEWAYFRGECKPAETTQSAADSWQTYTDNILGYSFEYPAEARIVISDEPKRGLEISGPGMGNEFWGIAHPGDMAEYQPPMDADLFQWLSDHNMLGEQRLPDLQIAGTTAIHFRHSRSPQSYAFDTYYLARNGQLYQLSIGHSSDIENWDLNNRFLHSIQFIAPAPTSSVATAIPTALPIDPSAYLDWQTYTHPVFGFSLRLPDDWVVEEVVGGGPGMDGHLIQIHPVAINQTESVRMTFREPGEEVLLWPTGVGQGDFFPGGNLDIAGEPALRMLLVCPVGEITSIWYYQSQEQPSLSRGQLEFGIIYSASPIHCQAGYSLSGKSPQVGETIISSLAVP